MPIHVSWQSEEKSIVYVQFDGEWTWEEYNAAAMQVEDMATTITHSFSQIVDFTKSQYVPKGEMMPAIGRGYNVTRSNFQLSVVVRPPTFIRSIVEMLKQWGGNPHRVIVYTVDEAFDFVALYMQDDDK